MVWKQLGPDVAVLPVRCCSRYCRRRATSSDLPGIEIRGPETMRLDHLARRLVEEGRPGWQQAGAATSSADGGLMPWAARGPISSPSALRRRRGRSPAGMDLRRPRGLVTGASSGFGEAVALGLAKAGAKVALAARREDRLRDLAARIQADVRGRGHRRRLHEGRTRGPAQRVRETEAAFGRLDIRDQQRRRHVPGAGGDGGPGPLAFDAGAEPAGPRSPPPRPPCPARPPARDGHIVNIASTAGQCLQPSWRRPARPPSSACSAPARIAAQGGPQRTTSG